MPLNSIHILRGSAGYDELGFGLALGAPPAEDLAAERRAVASRWVPVECYRDATDEDGVPLRRSAVPSAGDSQLVLAGQALAATYDLLSPWGELLPVYVEGQSGALFHCLNVVDALDIERSWPTYSPSFPEKVLHVSSYVFRPEVVPQGCVFQLPQEQPSGAFYTDGFIEAFTAATDTTGIDFPAVWTAEEGALPFPCLLDPNGRPIRR